MADTQPDADPHLNDEGLPDDLYEGALDIITFKHAVILAGPLGVRLAMTPDAAERSAILLLQAVAIARKAA